MDSKRHTHSSNSDFAVMTSRSRTAISPRLVTTCALPRRSPSSRNSPAAPQVLDERREERASGLLACSKRGGENLGHMGGLGERRELQEPHAVRILVDERRGNLE